METKWLEDFVTLAQTQNFSKAAALRCVTQPAFSRRIQSLEAWLGCELIDRGAYPTRLSSQGEVFYAQALDMLERLRETRTLLRGSGLNLKQQIRLVVPHTLSYSRIPVWLQTLKIELKDSYPELSFQLTARNVHDAVLHFTDGACDFLICFYHSREPVELDPARYEVKTLGVEKFRPYSRKNENGSVLFSLTDVAQTPVPILGYSRNAWLSGMVDFALTLGPSFFKKTVFETDLSVSLKAACEAGLGVAWLPDSAVGLKNDLLVELPGPYVADLEIRLFRRLVRSKENFNQMDLLDQVWNLWLE